MASDYFGRQVSNYRFEELARDAEQAMRITQQGKPPLLRRVTRLREKAHEFFDLLPPHEGRSALEPEARAPLSGGTQNVLRWPRGGTEVARGRDRSVALETGRVAGRRAQSRRTCVVRLPSSSSQMKRITCIGSNGEARAYS